MAVIPVTYIQFVIWLILVFVSDDHYDFLLKCFATFWGELSGVYALGGERWLFVSSTGTFTLTQFDDGLSTMMAAILIFGSVLIFYVAAVNYQEYRKKNNIRGFFKI